MYRTQCVPILPLYTSVFPAKPKGLAARAASACYAVRVASAPLHGSLLPDRDQIEHHCVDPVQKASALALIMSVSMALPEYVFPMYSMRMLTRPTASLPRVSSHSVCAFTRERVRAVAKQPFQRIHEAKREEKESCVPSGSVSNFRCSGGKPFRAGDGAPLWSARPFPTGSSFCRRLPARRRTYRRDASQQAKPSPACTR